MSIARAFRSPALLLVACAVAAAVPLLDARSAPAPHVAAEFPGWPTQFGGERLERLSPTETDRRFAKDLPGRVARFRGADTAHEVILRWTPVASRHLHPARVCLQASGYAISPLPGWRDAEGASWSRVEARKDDVTLEVRERVVDADGRSWSDVTEWYWAAVAGRTRGPWWVETIAVAR